MKKIQNVKKSFLILFLGALVLLSYLDYLQNTGASLAIGIIAVIFAAYYIIAGIVGSLSKGGKTTGVLEAIVMISFPVLLFVIFLITIINNAKILTITGWIVLLLSCISAIMTATIYALAVFMKSDALNKVARLFSAIFAVSLALNVIINPFFGPNVLGNIDLIATVMYFVYGYLLLSSFDE